jgi:hypothetical protein
VVDAEPVDQRQILIDAFDSERAGVVDRGELDRLSLDEQLPGIGLVIAGQDLDQGRFSGAVVAEDAERLRIASAPIVSIGPVMRAHRRAAAPDECWRPSRSGSRRR